MSKIMSKSPAYQWYPKDVLTSLRVMEMTLEEEGAYRRALDICWLHGSLPADLDRLAKVIGKGASVLVARVVYEMFEIDANDPSRLVHDRLDTERVKQEQWREKSSKGGKAGAGKPKKPKKISTINQSATKPTPNTQPNGKQNDTLQSSYCGKEESISIDSLREEPPQAAPTKKGTRIADPFILTADMKTYAAKKRPDIDPVLETEKFCNYWRAKTGKDATKLDWKATWRNWILNARSNGNGKQRSYRDEREQKAIDEYKFMQDLRGRVAAEDLSRKNDAGGVGQLHGILADPDTA